MSGLAAAMNNPRRLYHPPAPDRLLTPLGGLVLALTIAALTWVAVVVLVAALT